ncbi:MAG: hypothetical protein PUE91_02440 [Clostridiales bacterium]|nr:hypothetical protein [Clostridiales bacterium]
MNATTEDIRCFAAGFHGVQTVMLGRGLLANHGLAAQAEGREPVEKQK